MNAPRPPKVAGIDASRSPAAGTPGNGTTDSAGDQGGDPAGTSEGTATVACEDPAAVSTQDGAAPSSAAADLDAPGDGVPAEALHDGAPDDRVLHDRALHDRLARRICELTTLQELTEALAATDTLESAQHEVLRAGALLVGARRGLLVVESVTAAPEPYPSGPVSPQPHRSGRPGPAPHHPDPRTSDSVGDGGPEDDEPTARTGSEGFLAALGALDGIEDPDGTRTGEHTVALGLGRAELGQIETVPRSATSYGRLLDTPAGLPDGEREIAHPDLLSEDDLDPRHREVAARLGFAASYALPLTSARAGRVGAVVWLYDEPTEPTADQRHLVGLYTRQATEHLARLRELTHTRNALASLGRELHPPRLPRLPAARLAVRHRPARRGGGSWYDALTLPEGTFGLAVGTVTGSGPGAIAAMTRLRAGLRAYAVLEGEDPVAVLSDLELLLRMSEPARSATALYAYCEPDRRRVTFAGAGHSPPLLVGEGRTEFVESAVSAPLGMLSCWEAPGAEVSPGPGETLLLWTDGLLGRAGEPADRAYARLHSAAAGAPRVVREDPEALVDHVLRVMSGAGGGAGAGAGAEVGGEGGGVRCVLPPQADVVVMAVRFD